MSRCPQDMPAGSTPHHPTSPAPSFALAPASLCSFGRISQPGAEERRRKALEMPRSLGELHCVRPRFSRIACQPLADPRLGRGAHSADYRPSRGVPPDTQGRGMADLSEPTFGKPSASETARPPSWFLWRPFDSDSGSSVGTRFHIATSSKFARNGRQDNLPPQSHRR